MDIFQVDTITFVPFRPTASAPAGKISYLINENKIRHINKITASVTQLNQERIRIEN
jgi:hypothetical protein